jgi:hypothetical protein
MATKIQLRRDTASDWTSTNPTLAAGEFGWESDTNKFKIGDGATAWTSLAYASDGDTAGITFVGDDSTGTLVSQNETFKVAGTQNVTTAVSGDTLTVTGPDLSSYATGSSTTTFTNKTFDANGTGNSISNIETADIAAATLVTASEGIGSNDNDTTIPTSAAVKAYADSVGGGGASLGDLTAVGSTLSSPSNGTLALETSGTGKVVLAANNGDYESRLSSTRYTNSNNLYYQDLSETLATGTQRYMNSMVGEVTLTASQSTSTNSNDRWRNQNLVRLDMNGNSSTNSSSTYRSRGPLALSNYTTLVNGGGSSSTLGNAGASLNGIYGYINNQDVTITAATGVNAILEFESDGTGDLNVTEWRGFQSFADAYGSSGSLNVTNFYHYYCDTPGGNITNQYAFYDATNSLSVFGDIQTQAVSITDNLITTNRSNDNLYISANGTGRVNLGDVKLEDADYWGMMFGNASRIKGTALTYEDLAVNPNDLTDRELGHGIYQGTKITASSTNSNFRPRALLVGSAVDLAGFSYTNTNNFRGPLGAQIYGAVSNGTGTDVTCNTIRGVESSASVNDFTNTSGAITVVDAIGNFCANYHDRNGTGDINVTNDYGFKFAPESYNAGGGTGVTTITNSYAFHCQAGSGNATVTNAYAFYSTDATASSRMGAIRLDNQSGDPTHGADFSWIYAKDAASSSEVYVKDEAGNVTQISPHNEAGEWQYWSENIKTGKKVRINMERMIKRLEEITGETFIESE